MKLKSIKKGITTLPKYMKKIDNKELKEIIQSGHINLLVGSGCSLDYLTTLKDIEDRMNVEETKEQAQKDYYTLMKKSKSVLNESFETETAEKKNLTKTRKNYDSFLGFWANTISSRSLHIVNKQVNICKREFRYVYGGFLRASRYSVQ